MIKVNLVPQEILDKELQRQRSVQASAAGGVILVVLLAVSSSHYYTSVRLARQLEESEAKFKKLQAIVAKVEELEQKAQAVRARLNVMQDLLIGRPLYPRFMEDILRSLPSGVWLLSMSGSAEGTGLKLSMGAKAVTSDDVSRWLRTLEAGGRWSNPSIGTISVDANDGSRSFTMSVVYTPDLKR